MSDPALAEILRIVQDNNKSIASMRYDIATTKEAVQRMEIRLDQMELDSAEAVKNLTTHVTKEEEMWKMFDEGWPVNPKTQKRDPRYHADGHEREDEKAAERKGLWKELHKVVFVAGILAILGGAWALLVSGAKIEITRAIQPVEVKK